MGNGDKGVSPLDGHAVAPDWMQGRTPQGYIARKEGEQDDFEDQDHDAEDEDEESSDMTESDPGDRAEGEVARSVLPDLRPFTRSKVLGPAHPHPCRFSLRPHGCPSS